MSLRGSLLGYENNNEIGNKQQQHHQQQQQKSIQSSLLQNTRNNSIKSTESTQSTTASSISSTFSMGKNCASSLNSSFSNSIIIGGTANITGGIGQHKYMNSKRKHTTSKYNSMASGHHPHSSASSHLVDHNNYLHLNSLWSIWYGVLLTLFQGYLAVHGAYRFLGCSLIPWKIEPVAELNLQIVLSGVVFILLPLFFTSAVFKVGNLANDGIKLASGTKAMRRCSITPADGLEEEARGGTLRALWTHGGPTAAFVHIVIALCLLLPRLLLEARIIENGLLPKENIWQTELDFITVNRRNLVALSVITAPYQNMTTIEDAGNDEDYFNDTMFTGIGVGVGVGYGGNIAIGGNGNLNNNLLDIKPEQKQPQQQPNGKTRFFEVPDLINRAEYNNNNKNNNGNNNKIEQQLSSESNDGYGKISKNTDDMGNQYYSNKGGNNYHGFGIEDNADVDDDDDNIDNDEVDEKLLFDKTNNAGQNVLNSNDFDINGRQSVQQFEEEPVPPTKTSTTLTTKATDKSISTIATTYDTSVESTIETSSLLNIASKRNFAAGKSYDQSWDKLATLDKKNSLSDTTKLTSTKATTTTTADATTTSISTSTSTKLASKATIATTTTTTSGSATSTTIENSDELRTSKLASPQPQLIVPVTSTFSSPTQATTLPTIRTHQHQHQHQHHQHQHNHNHNHNQQHGRSSTRKHGNNRHHQHRQRGQNARRHHASAVSSTTHATATVATSASGININRFDEFDELSNIKSKTYSISSSYEDEESKTDLGRARAYFPKSTSVITTTTARDSNIHIVKPEILPPEIIPSTPLTSNSKIIEIKTKSKKVKRMADDAELQVEIEPEYLIGDLPGGVNGNVGVGVGGIANIAGDVENSHNDTSSEFIMTSSTVDSSTNDNGNNNDNNTNINIDDDVDVENDVLQKQQEQEQRNQQQQQAEQTPSIQTGIVPIVRLDGFAGMLQIFFGIEKPIDVAIFAQPPSAEFMNLIFALLVWCVRYPAVFWAATKPFATIFSIQMIAGALDIIFGYIGIANLYKLQVYSEAMPIQNPGLILNGIVTLALFLLSTVLVLASSMIMYLYGHGRLAAKMRDRSLITLKASETWIYFAHCASLCFVLALAVVKAPLLNDLSATYKNNLHCPTFISALISVVHLLLWIVIWLGLTVKRRWSFKLPPVDVYGFSKATTQPLLLASNRTGSIPSSGSSSISGCGSGTATHTTDQKGVISNLTTTSNDGGGQSQNLNQSQCHGQGNGNSNSNNSGNCSHSGGVGCINVGHAHHHNNSGNNGTDTEDIYWPKLAPNSPKLKVTFNEVTSTSDDDVLLIDGEQQQQQQLLQHEQIMNDGNKRNQIRGAQVCFAGATREIDDGEYATLRAATAATVVGIGMNLNARHRKTNSSGSGNGNGNVNVNSGVGCGGATTQITTPNNGSISISGSVQILQLDEYDELPPPPPPMMSMTQHNNTTPSGVVATTSTTVTATITGIVGDYANLGTGLVGLGLGLVDDNISEEGGKLLECVRDDSVTYASTRELDPPKMAASSPPPLPPHPHILDAHNNINNNSNNNNNNHGCTLVAINTSNNVVSVGRAPQAIPENMQLSSSPEHLVSPLAPVTVTVHTNEAHIHPSSTPRCLRRADSGVPNEALTPRSDTTSTTESTTTSPPERAPSESSSGVHSGEEREVEVVIRPRVGCKPPAKPPQPVIQEEPYGRCTNMRMSSFVSEPVSSRISGIIGIGSGAPSSSATLPLTRSTPEQKFDYTSHCSTMPLPVGCHSQINNSGGYSSSSAQSMMQQQQQLQQQQQPQNVSTFKSMYANSAVAMAGANAAAAAAAVQQQQQQQQHQLLHQQLQQHLQQHQLQQSLHTTLPNGVRYSNPQHILRRLPHISKAAESPYGHLGLGAGHHTFSKLLHDPLQVVGNSLANSVIPEDRDSANYSMNSDYDTNLYSTANHLN